MSDYRDLVVWQCAHDLTLQIYSSSKSFPRDEMFGVTSQLRRAASSVPANIAEGNGRGTRKDYLHFLTIARGSLARYFVQLATDLGYLSAEQSHDLQNRVARVALLLAGLIRSLQRSLPS